MAAPVSSGSSGYIRGGGGVEIGTRRVGRIIAYLAVLGLIGVGIWLAVTGTQENSRIHRLHGGVTVPASVTGCRGISSGIGMGVEYWECRASYAYQGRQYDEVIGGSRQRLTVGQSLPVVIVPSDPRIASTVKAAHKRSPGPSVYIAPVVMLLLALGLGGWLLRTRPRSAGS